MAEFRATNGSKHKSKYKINLSDGDLVASHKLMNEKIKKIQKKDKTLTLIIIILLSVISFLILGYYGINW